MVTIGILEQRPTLSALLEACLPQELWRDIQLVPAESLPERAADLLVVSSDVKDGPGTGLACRALLVPGRLSALAGEIPASFAVSYGNSPRDSLTFSSFGDDMLALALQREVITLNGACLERQELMLPRAGHTAPFHVLACAGVQLLLGVPPEKISVGPAIQTS